MTSKPYLAAEELAGLKPGVLDEAAVDFFANGHCASMALALHRITGWRMYVFRPRFNVNIDCPDGDPCRFCSKQHLYWSHAVVSSPIGFLDASGVVSFKDWRENQDLDADDCRVFPVNDMKYAEENLALVMPFAQAVLERYFPTTLADVRSSSNDHAGR